MLSVKLFHKFNYTLKIPHNAIFVIYFFKFLAIYVKMELLNRSKIILSELKLNHISNVMGMYLGKLSVSRYNHTDFS